MGQSEHCFIAYNTLLVNIMMSLVFCRMTNKLAYICNAFYDFIYSCFATQIVKYIICNQHIKPGELKLSVIHGNCLFI